MPGPSGPSGPSEAAPKPPAPEVDVDNILDLLSSLDDDVASTVDGDLGSAAVDMLLAELAEVEAAAEGDGGDAECDGVDHVDDEDVVHGRDVDVVMQAVRSGVVSASKLEQALGVVDEGLEGGRAIDVEEDETDAALALINGFCSADVDVGLAARCREASAVFEEWSQVVRSGVDSYHRWKFCSDDFRNGTVSLGRLGSATKARGLESCSCSLVRGPTRRNRIRRSDDRLR
jgi:hypothetical protein